MDYNEFVKSKIKDPQAILDSLTPHKVDVMHMVVGIVGEFAELVNDLNDSLKNPKQYTAVFREEMGDIEFFWVGLMSSLELVSKDLPKPTPNTNPNAIVDLAITAMKGYTIYNKDIDLDSFKQLLADVRAFLYQGYKEFGIPRSLVLAENRAKLDKRYVKGFTDAEASDRADKQ